MLGVNNRRRYKEMAKTIRLHAWDIAAIEKAVADAIEEGTLDSGSGRALLEKIRAAKRITVTR